MVIKVYISGMSGNKEVNKFIEILKFNLLDIDCEKKNCAEFVCIMSHIWIKKNWRSIGKPLNRFEDFHWNYLQITAICLFKWFEIGYFGNYASITKFQICHQSIRSFKFADILCVFWCVTLLRGFISIVHSSTYKQIKKRFSSNKFLNCKHSSHFQSINKCEQKKNGNIINCLFLGASNFFIGSIS